MKSFLCGPQLFRLLIAGAKTCEVNRNRALRCKRLRHELRQLLNPVLRRQDGREQCSWRGERSGQQQVHRFIDGDKVASRLGAGDRQRSALLDLARKDLGHVVAGVQYVAQAQNRTPCGEHNLLGDALAGAHHRGRLNGLVGGEQHHARAMRSGNPNENSAAEDVVLDRRQRMFFHQRHVLEGCGVIDNARRVMKKNLFEQRLVARVAEDGNHSAGRAGGCPVALKGVELALGGLQ